MSTFGTSGSFGHGQRAAEMRSSRLRSLAAGVASEITDLRESSVRKRAYKVGDVGPAGGIIFYVDYFGAMPFTYLEAAPSDAANNDDTLTIDSARVLDNGLVEYSYNTVPSMPLRLSGANVTGMLPASFNFANKTITFSGDGRLSPKVVGAEVSGGSVIYTTSAPHTITVGTLVTVTQLPGAFNIANRAVTAVSASTFTVDNTGGASGSTTQGGRLATNRFTVQNTTGAVGASLQGGQGPSSTVNWHSITNNWIGNEDWASNGVAAGPLNTNLMLSAAPGSGAAKLVSQYRHGDYDDWHLPSLGALMAMYYNLREVGAGVEFGPQYWSSTGNTVTNAWSHVFDAGAQNSASKSSQLRVRPVRAFD